LPAFEGDGYSEAEGTGHRDSRPDKTGEIGTPGP
jgi:hypothetical protein